MNIRLNWTVLLAGAALTGCTTMPYQPYARDVKRKPATGGVIALHLEHRTEDRQKADEMMKSNCGAKPVKVIEEGEVVVGQKTETNARESDKAGTSDQKVGTLFGMPVMSSGTSASRDTNAVASTTALKEWQISYECDTVPVVSDAAPVQKASHKKSKIK